MATARDADRARSVIPALLVPSVRPREGIAGALPVTGTVAQTFQLVLRAYLIGGGYTIAAGVAWQSSSTGVATVNSAGLVTLTGAGSATITATYQGRSYTTPVTATAFTQPNALANLILWLKSDTLVLNDGDAVGTWADQSGGSRDLSQATPSAKPLYKTNIVNGRAVVRFDGVDDLLTRATGGLTGAAPHTILGVVRFNVVSHYQAIATVGAGTSNTSGVGVTDVGALFGGGATDGTAVSGDIDHRSAFHVFSKVMLNDGSSSSDLVYVDGAALALNLPTDVITIGDAGFGMGNVGTGNPTAGDVAEVTIYSRALSGSERLQIEEYLGNRYAITVP